MKDSFIDLEDLSVKVTDLIRSTNKNRKDTNKNTKDVNMNKTLPDTILITGITGFVGSHLAEYIINYHPTNKIIGLARWRSPLDNINHIQDKIEIVYGDLLDLPSIINIISKQQPNIIFHLAAQSYVTYSFNSPISTLETNIIGTANLLEAIRITKEHAHYDPIVHTCSSSEVYGQVLPDETPIKETNPLRPASPYAVSKIGEDMISYQYWLSHKIKTIRTRMFTHTGERRGDVFAESNFAKQIAKIEAGIQEPIIYTGNLNSVRTFLDVKDAVKAYYILTEKCKPGEVYNIGGNETMTVGEMLNKLIKMSPKRDIIKIKTDPSRLRPSDVTLQIPDTTKFRRTTGWKPEIPIDETLKSLLNYWRNVIYNNQKNTK